MLCYSFSCLPSCVVCFSMLLLVLFILLLRILFSMCSRFQGSFSIWFAVTIYIYIYIYTLCLCVHSITFSLFFACITINGYVSSVMLWNVNDINILFVYFVSQWNGPLCVCMYMSCQVYLTWPLVQYRYCTGNHVTTSSLSNMAAPLKAQ